MRAVILWLLTIFMLSVAPANAVTYPTRPDGPILDQANIIPDAEQAALDTRLREYNQRTGRAVIAATVPSIEGETIELYAVKLFEQWGIGGAKRDQGVLLLVAPNERKVRIEVGYGLHPYITDIWSGRTIRNEIAPRFKQGDMAGGISAGVDALIQQLDRTPAEAQAIAEAAAAAEAQSREGDKPGFGSVIFWIVLILVFMFLFGRGGRRGGRRFSSDGLAPIILWDAVSRGGGWSSGGGGFGGGDSGGGFGGFGGGMSGGGGASGDW